MGLGVALAGVLILSLECFASDKMSNHQLVERLSFKYKKINSDGTHYSTPPTFTKNATKMHFSLPTATVFLASTVAIIMTMIESVVASPLPPSEQPEAAVECPVGCPTLYDPVCAAGMSGRQKTFENSCYLDLHNCKYPYDPYQFIRDGAC
ncbi:hypothetical protein BX616_001843 [Lobosporangium transversale]|nr:hypothetical protein BX616_001843 [Lobosporangium transversale]